MGSSFKGKDLFGSGPHRFAMGRQGQLLVRDLDFGGLTPETFPIGLEELTVKVVGRLVAASESGLWVLRDAVVDELLDPPTAGELIDLHGRSWADMSFVRYVEADRVDRGRVWSVGYEAEFRRFTTVNGGTLSGGGS